MLKRLFYFICLNVLCYNFYAQDVISRTIDNELSFVHNKIEFDGDCIENVFTDSKGKLWISNCGLTSRSTIGLVGHNGYKSFVPNVNSPKLNNLDKNYFGIYKDKMFGYANSYKKSYLFYFDLRTKNVAIYDSLEIDVLDYDIAKPLNPNGDNRVFQYVIDNKLETYITSSSGDVVLNIFDIDSKCLTFISKPLPTNGKRYTQGQTFFKNRLLYIDESNGELYIYNFKTETTKKVELRAANKQLNVKTFSIHDGYLYTMYKEKKYMFEILEDNGIVFKYIDFNNNNQLPLFTDQKGNVIKLIDNKKRNITLIDNGTKNKEVVYALDVDVNVHQVLKIYGEDFFKEIYILTSKELIIIRPKIYDGLLSFKTTLPTRGLDYIEQKKIYLYLGETGLNSERGYDPKNDSIIRKVDICGFNRLKLLRDGKSIWGVSKGDIAFYDTEKDYCEKLKLKNKVATMTFDKKGNIIYLDERLYFWHYNFTEETSIPLKYNGKALKVSSEYTDYIMDEDNNLWIASIDGLFKYNLRENALISYNEYLENFNYKFNTLAMGDDNNLWLGTTNSGVLIFNKDKMSYTIIDEEKGLSNNTISSITEDNNGHYWIGTYNGISVVNKSGEIVSNIYEEDGLIHNECNRFSSKLLPNGNIIIGSIEGFTLINPVHYLKSLVNARQNFSLSFSELIYTVNEATISRQHGIEDVEDVKLNPENRNLYLEFGSTNYYDPNSTTYAYKIEGNLDWIDLKTNNFLFLNHLPVGQQFILIKGIDNHGNKSSNILKLNVFVKDYYYNKIEFYALIIFIVLFISIVWIIMLRERIRISTAKIKSQTERLKALDKSKNTFFTNITHEFRTPLTVINGLTTLIREDKNIDKDKELLSIQNQTKDLLNMVNKILDLQKIEYKKLHTNYIQSDIITYLKYLVDISQSLVGLKNISLSITTTEDSIIMDYDEDKIKAILTNLLSNAVKFSSDGSKIEVWVIIIKDTNDKHLLEIKVSDNGIGISTKEQALIFEKFYQSKNNKSISFNGSGIGLYYVYQLILLMKGTINCESKINEKTTFTVQLPISNNAPFKNEQLVDKLSKDRLIESHIHPDISRGGKNNALSLLIAEDNPSVQNVLNKQLSRDYNIIFANDGEEGIALALKTIPDVIISDVMMPKKNGFELCKILKSNKETSHIPIILLTAKADQNSKLEGLNALADSYIYKPYDIRELKYTIKNVNENRKKLHRVYKYLEQDSQPTILPDEDIFIKELRLLIETNLQRKDLDTSFICESLNLSRSSLHKKIKALTGLSITAYVNHVKLYKARDLMQDIRFNNKEVCYSVGFNTYEHFSRIFKTEFGIGPKEYRDRLNN